MPWTVLLDLAFVRRMRAWVGRYPALGLVIPRLLQELPVGPDAHPNQAPTLIRHTTAYGYLLSEEDGLAER